MELENVFIPPKKHSVFSWDSLGDIQKGREDLGPEMPVLVYRLMQYTMLDVLCREHGEEAANDYFRKGGYLAGLEFAKNVLNTRQEFSAFLAELQAALRNLKIGILRMESCDEETGLMILTVEQDLDCSGLPITNEVVCTYDEGFIAGILEVYTGVAYRVREVDCWATGDRVCRFRCSTE